jgi:hypothetical protein
MCTHVIDLGVVPRSGSSAIEYDLFARVGLPRLISLQLFKTNSGVFKLLKKILALCLRACIITAVAISYVTRKE